jgi:hypothetical protein
VKLLTWLMIVASVVLSVSSLIKSNRALARVRADYARVLAQRICEDSLQGYHTYVTKSGGIMTEPMTQLLRGSAACAFNIRADVPLSAPLPFKYWQDPVGKLLEQVDAFAYQRWCEEKIAQDRAKAGE